MKKAVYKIKIGFICLVLGMLASPVQVSAEEENHYVQNFVISAYYSPVPGQARYATGTYSGDIRLNGNGVHTADGSAVADMNGGFVAAPPNFAFGTKMEIDGLGVFVVHDRGGAIKGNRLDVWMGYGDDGLNKALNWGKRTVSVKVYTNGDGVQVANNIDSTFDHLADYQKVTVESPMEFSRELQEGDKGEDVARLQQFLKDQLLYFGEVNGKFDNLTKDALIRFQKNNGLLDEADFAEAGRFGAVSISMLETAVVSSREKYLNGLPARNLGRGATGEEVRKLQEILVKLGYLDSVTGVYDTETTEGVLKFQLAEGVIESESDKGAGYFGPGTQLALQKVHFMLLDGIYEATEKMDETEEFGKETEEVNYVYLQEAEMISFNLSEGDEGKDVENLQLVLRDLNLLKVDPTGHYGPLTAHAVFKFQQKTGLVNSRDEAAAGKVGPQTKQALNGYLEAKNRLLSQKLGKGKKAVTEKFAEKRILQTAKVGDRGESVKRLQSFLKEEGYFEGKFTTEYFGEVTKNALVEYQMDNDLIVDFDDSDAGALNVETMNFINTRL